MNKRGSFCMYAATAVALLAAGSSMHAQQPVSQPNSYQGGPVKRDPVQRTADGIVLNKAEAPVPGAIVYLKDSKSLTVRSFITDDAGHFHFGQLGQSTDYELWAQLDGVRSKSKAISSFDSKNSYNFTLRIDAAKADPPKPDTAK